MSTVTLPPLAGANVEYNNYYESKLNQRFGLTDTNCYPQDLPAAAAGFLVLDPAGAAPEHIFYNAKGSNYVSVPSITAGQGRGVGGTPITDWPAGTTVGIYTIAEYFEGIVTGVFMRDGFLQTRHFSSSIDPNSWIGTGETWNYVGNLGNRTFQYLVAGDKTAKYSNGMKLRLPRVVTVPTQSALFARASNQWATRLSASIAGLTATNNITIEGRIKLGSYISSQAQTILARRDASGNGFQLRIEASGSLAILGLNANAFRQWTGTRAVPVNEWIHVSASMDLNGNVAHLYYDGEEIETTQQSSGTPVAFVEAGDLGIGRAGSSTASENFDGGMEEIRLWTAIRSQAQILDTMHKQLVGNEANLAGYWKLAGNFNDSSPNANHLTAAGGATATNTDSMLSATEYAHILDRSFAAGNTTITVRTPRAFAPYENLSGIAYSAAEAPVGLPIGMQRKLVVGKAIVVQNATSPAASTTGAPVPGLKTTPYMVAGQTYKIVVTIPQVYNTVDAIRQDFHLMDNGVEIFASYQRGWTPGNGGVYWSLTIDYVPTTTGLHPLQVYFGVPSGGLTMFAAFTAPAFIKVEV